MTNAHALNRRILVVDDLPAIHEDFRKVLGAGTHGAGETDQELASLESLLFADSKAKTSPASSGKILPLTRFEVDSAFQGEEALAKVEAAARENRPYSLVFMDVRMPPGWNGIKTIGKIWEKNPDTEVVICTAYSDYPLEQINVELGSSDHLLILKKPFDPVEVLQAALSLTTKWNQARKLAQYINQIEQNLEKTTTDLHYTRAATIQQAKMAALGQMAGGIAHEINSPLTSILLSLEEIQSSLEKPFPPVPHLMTCTESAISNIHRIAGVIEGLRSFCGEQNRQVPASLISVHELIQNSLDLCSQKFAFNSIRITVKPIQSDLKAYCRPLDLTHVLLNLLNNAFDAINHLPEKWIEIEASERGPWLNIVVTDSGKGIANDIAESIFQPFFTTKPIGSNVGLGLSTAKGIIDTHQGEIVYDPEHPYTRFIISIPRSKAIGAV